MSDSRLQEKLPCRCRTLPCTAALLVAQFFILDWTFSYLERFILDLSFSYLSFSPFHIGHELFIFQIFIFGLELD